MNKHLVKCAFFPLAWGLNPREGDMLLLLAANDRSVTSAELEAVVALHRISSKPGRPLKVHMHYLRKRLLPHGIRIRWQRQTGYRLSPGSREIVAPYLVPTHRQSAA